MPGVAACENAGSGKVARAMPLLRDTSLSREGGLLVCGGGAPFAGSTTHCCCTSRGLKPVTAVAQKLRATR